MRIAQQKLPLLPEGTAAREVLQQALDQAEETYIDTAEDWEGKSLFATGTDLDILCGIG